MVTTVTHIKNTLGLDITLSDQKQSRSNLLKGFDNLTDDQMKRLPPASYLEPIYDVVTGIDGRNGCHFDITQNDEGRFKHGELRQLEQLASKMQNRPGTLEGQKTVLNNIAAAANAYRGFLEGSVPLVAKDLINLGNRHSLFRGAHGHLYEMTNSMTPTEISRFRRKTGMLLDAIENPNRKYRQNGKIFTKIELGKGAFGKIRIARDIEADTYVAVKKIHPKLKLSVKNGFNSQKPEPSNFYNLDDSTKEKLKSIKDFVITPDDETKAASQLSKNIFNLANQLANWKPRTSAEIINVINKYPDIKEFLTNLPDEDRDNFVTNLLTGNFIHQENAKHTAYTFSELGTINIDSFIENLNVLRLYFESNESSNKLDEKSKEIILKYAKSFYIPPSNITSEAEQNEFYKNEAIATYDSDKFKLKDPVYNQRFLNTLGKKMITALAKLNSLGINHQDIKPDNIVLVQDRERNISVKLIDIDLLQESKGTRKQPSQGCIPFMPPEALFNERDGSVSYLGTKGDAYAMGLTLRRVIGFGFKEIVATSKIQKIKVAIDTNAVKELDDNAEEKLAESINAMNLSQDTNVQNQLHIKAIMSAVPQAVSLKEISDLMLKEHPGKRLTAEDVISDFSFFDEEAGNILSDKEFSDHALRICRYGLVVDKGDIDRINNTSEEAGNPLATLRRHANEAMVRARHQEPDPNSGYGLSRREAEKVTHAETLIQAKAGVRRLGRSMSDFFSNKSNIADQKMQYKKR